MLLLSLSLVLGFTLALDLGTQSCVPQSDAFHKESSKDYLKCAFRERTENWITFMCGNRGYVNYDIKDNVLYYEIANDANSVHSLTTHVSCLEQTTNRQVAHADLYIPVWPHTTKKEWYPGLNRKCDLNSNEAGGFKLKVESYTMSDAAYNECMRHPIKYITPPKDSHT